VSHFTSVINRRALVWQLVPGMVAPGILYFLVSRRASVLVALAVASSVPLIDAVVRLARGKAPNAVGVLFVLGAAVSVGLAFWSGSSMFILAKGAVVSAVLGIGFAVSAALRRPLTRTLAIRLLTSHLEGRRRLAERWRHPRVLDVFCVLSVGWGILLLIQGAQQAVVALTLPPGTVMALEPPLQLAITSIGVVASVLYVRRRQDADPEVALLPPRSS
jgi:intracellular septation protein A